MYFKWESEFDKEKRKILIKTVTVSIANKQIITTDQKKHMITTTIMITDFFCKP